MVSFKEQMKPLTSSHEYENLENYKTCLYLKKEFSAKILEILFSLFYLWLGVPGNFIMLVKSMMGWTVNTVSYTHLSCFSGT